MDGGVGDNIYISKTAQTPSPYLGDKVWRFCYASLAVSLPVSFSEVDDVAT